MTNTPDPRGLSPFELIQEKITENGLGPQEQFGVLNAWLVLAPVGEFPNGSLWIGYASRLQPHSTAHWSHMRPEPRIGQIPDEAARRIYQITAEIQDQIKAWKDDVPTIQDRMGKVAKLMLEGTLLLNRSYKGMGGTKD